MKTTIMLAALLAALPSLACAQKMPKGAIPLTGDEITALYADHTAVFNATTRAYFSADNKTKGVNGKTPFQGTWAITGNEICMSNQGLDAKTKKWSDKFASDCWRLSKAGAVTWTLYSKAWDGKKVDLVNAWYKDNSLKPGDLASDKFKALGGDTP